MALATVPSRASFTPGEVPRALMTLASDGRHGPESRSRDERLDLRATRYPAARFVLRRVMLVDASDAVSGSRVPVFCVVKVVIPRPTRNATAS